MNPSEALADAENSLRDFIGDVLSKKLDLTLRMRTMKEIEAILAGARTFGT